MLGTWASGVLLSWAKTVKIFATHLLKVTQEESKRGGVIEFEWVGEGDREIICF